MPDTQHARYAVMNELEVKHCLPNNVCEERPSRKCTLTELNFFKKIIHVSNQKLKLIAHVRASTYLLECGMFG